MQRLGGKLENIALPGFSDMLTVITNPQDKVPPGLKYADQNDIFVTESGLGL